MDCEAKVSVLPKFKNFLVLQQVSPSNHTYGWQSTFCDYWKKMSLLLYFSRYLEKRKLILFHKKGDKRILKNYSLISLFLIFDKIFGKLIFNTSYLFKDHKSPNLCQAGLKKYDSCISFICSNLVSRTHQIYSNFECNLFLEVQGVFLDLSKAFNKVWCDGLRYKLLKLGISESQ